ncbi:MAG: isoleucine--tRNA ligase [Acidobacteriota bacterium]
MSDWKDTLNLPRTDFPMKANLPATEPETIARWDADGLYGRLRDARRGRPRFVLHDGPPYANGQIHIGHALNKILKDIIVRARSMSGYDAPYVPGWDCHGLPIELNVEKELGAAAKDRSPVEFRRACRDYAEKYVGLQRDDFKRLGVMGDWDNPYITMRPEYQATIVRALGAFVERGLVYKGKKPVHWCLRDRTALAEAEVEYENHTSPSIYVEFDATAHTTAVLRARFPSLAGHAISALIWTTTPWTIPANLGVAFHPDHEYGAFEVEGRAVIVAAALADRVAQATGRSFGTKLASIDGSFFERLAFQHPLYPRESLAVLANYVTLDQGTGVVHTAPGHGSDDFATGVRYGLDIYAPIGRDGRFLPDVDIVAGLKVFEANPVVEAALAERGRLFFRTTLEHTYPHCWRCHQPVIFLATAQWFISMDRLRASAVTECDRVEWFPAWGRERMTGMFVNRPDWCISRQRAWGVPIPALSCQQCSASLLTPAIIERAAAVFEQESADAWYEKPVSAFVPDGLTCADCGGTTFERERDILDVWFDSGCSHEAVLAKRPALTWPADLYLEGTDQYRGWFQSSLLVGLGTREHAPYNSVLTHGFVVDEHGRKMSKSLGNTILPQQIIKDSGAEVMRLWVSMVDYRDEVRLGKAVLARTVEAYRKIRNTFRYLLSNLYDFAPATDSLARDALLEVDRFMLARFARLAVAVRGAYATYDFQTIFQAVNEFVTVDLSAFYADVSKDRLYTLRADAPERRSAQTAYWIVADGLTRLLAPILSVTTDEIWQHLPGRRETSVHLAEFPADLDTWLDDSLEARWTELLDIRRDVNGALEKARQEKAIGSALGAHVTVKVAGHRLRLLREYEADLPMLFIASAVTLEDGPADEINGSGDADGVSGDMSLTTTDSVIAIAVRPAAGDKCPRCWRIVTETVPDGPHAGLCLRCDNAIGGASR